MLNQILCQGLVNPINANMPGKGSPPPVANQYIQKFIDLNPKTNLSIEQNMINIGDSILEHKLLYKKRSMNPFLVNCITSSSDNQGTEKKPWLLMNFAGILDQMGKTLQDMNYYNFDDPHSAGRYSKLVQLSNDVQVIINEENPSRINAINTHGSVRFVVTHQENSLKTYLPIYQPVTFDKLKTSVIGKFKGIQGFRIMNRDLVIIDSDVILQTSIRKAYET